MKPPSVMNGTRAVITNLQTHIVTVKISAGLYKGLEIRLPRVHFTLEKSTLPFTMRRI